MMRSKFPRLSALVGSLALVGLGLAAVPTTAQATVVLQPRTYTTTMTPTSAVPGQSTAYTAVVKNTSSSLSSLLNFSLSIPSGFTVVPGSVTAPRGGWTESLNAAQTLLTATPAKPLLQGLLRGESMTLTFNATDTTACDTSTVTWTPAARGPVVAPFTLQGGAPTVQMTPVADRFVITSVTDGSNPALDHQVVVGQPFFVAGQFRCGATLVAPAASAGTLTLSKTAPGTPSNSGGALGGTVTQAVAAGDTTDTISGATYSAIESAVGMGVAWTGGTGDSFTIDALGAAQTATGTPGSALSLTVPEATLNLGNGAKGTVSIVVSACTDQLTVPCSGGTQVEVNAKLTGPNGELYGFGTPNSPLAPAEVTRVCPAAQCPHRDPRVEPSQNYNYDPNNDEQGEDFADYPTFVSIRTTASPNGTPFALAVACVPSTDTSTTNQIVTQAAQQAGFCVDVNAITRTNNSFNGDLLIPILYVEDFKFRP